MQVPNYLFHIISEYVMNAKSVQLFSPLRPDRLILRPPPPLDPMGRFYAFFPIRIFLLIKIFQYSDPMTAHQRGIGLFGDEEEQDGKEEGVEPLLLL